jgi:response regulator RpfG family c-di-GMP phosphodiesterase
MDGLELLKALAAVQPECARIVLSGQTDMNALVKMVNETHIFRFIPKPWHDYFLKSSVAQAIELAGVLRENRRLAGVVRERGIAVPPLLGNAADEVLIVDGDAAAAANLERVLSSHAETDDLFAAIRAEVAQQPVGTLEEAKTRIAVAASGHAALALAQTQAYSCVLADFKLPDMSGIDFLQQFADRQPDCTRMLTSSHLTQNDLIDAVDAAHIFGFVAKPWLDYEVKAGVAQGLAQHRMVLENRVLAEMVRKAGGASA